LRAEHPGWSEQDVQNELAGHQAIEAGPFAAALRGMQFDLLELLDAVRAPVLLVLGAEERESRLTGETRREALRRVPASEHDAGHVVHRDDYEGYIRVVASHLDAPA
jgi:pimeloyl-ACP methyl ester carboxylesterase